MSEIKIKSLIHKTTSGTFTLAQYLFTLALLVKLVAKGILYIFLTQRRCRHRSHLCPSRNLLSLPKMPRVLIATVLSSNINIRLNYHYILSILCSPNCSHHSTECQSVRLVHLENHQSKVLVTMKKHNNDDMMGLLSLQHLYIVMVL